MKKNIFWKKTFFVEFSKKGSNTVFLSIILTAIFFMVITFIIASQKVGSIGYINSILTMSFKSIMSEYNIELKDRYGLFAFRGNSNDVENKVFYYSNYSFQNKGNIVIDNIKVDTSEYSLSDVNVAKNEIVEYGKYIMEKKFFDEIIGNENIETEYDNRKERILKNEGIIEALPSFEYKKNETIWNKISDFLKLDKDFIDNTTDGYFVNQYIMNLFGNYHRKPREETFFKGEVEYILSGNSSDKTNYQEFISELRQLRISLNTLHIITDPSKISKINAVSKTVGAATGGVGEVITKISLIELWALAETENDIALLKNGKKVSLIKTNESWATDLTSIITNTSSNYIDTKINNGLSYEGYLLLFLTFMDEEIKIARVLDLIQINMQGLYDKDFFIHEQNTGFNINVRVNGKEYIYKEEY